MLGDDSGDLAAIKVDVGVHDRRGRGRPPATAAQGAVRDDRPRHAGDEELFASFADAVRLTCGHRATSGATRQTGEVEEVAGRTEGQQPGVAGVRLGVSEHLELLGGDLVEHTLEVAVLVEQGVDALGGVEDRLRAVLHQPLEDFLGGVDLVLGGRQVERRSLGPHVGGGDLLSGRLDVLGCLADHLGPQAGSRHLARSSSIRSSPRT